MLHAKSLGLWLVPVACCLCATTVAALDRELTISVYQGSCRDGDFAANLASARRIIAQALSTGSDFLAFPETFLSGYDTAEHVRQGARPMDDPHLAALIEESRSHQMVILIGLARKTERGIYNSVLVIQSGELLGIYDKSILTGPDRDRLGFLPGTSMPVFDAHGIRFAVNVCHDTSFPHPALLARMKGAQLLFTPHYNRIGDAYADDHRRWVRNCHIALACQMKMVVARANIVGPGQDEGVTCGDSLILSPQGEVLAEARLFREQLVTAKITPAMFKPPVVWADLSEVPAWMEVELADRLRAKTQP